MLLSVPGKVLNRVLLERMKDDVDLKLRDNQAGQSGWISEQQAMCRPDCKPPYNHRTIARMELTPVHQFYRFREGVRLRGQAYALETDEAL